MMDLLVRPFAELGATQISKNKADTYLPISCASRSFSALSGHRLARKEARKMSRSFSVMQTVRGSLDGRTDCLARVEAWRLESD